MPPIFTPLVSFQLAAARRRLGGNIVRNGGQPLLFQLAAARRRLADMFNRLSRSMPVSTRSRPKAAGQAQKWDISEIGVSTRSRPKAAGIGQLKHRIIQNVSTRSRPKAAGKVNRTVMATMLVSTRSRPKAAGRGILSPRWPRLVSTRSRPKAAGAAAETLSPQGLHHLVSLRFLRRHMALLYHSQVRPIFPNC